MVFKLSPFRRILLIASIIFIVSGRNNQNSNAPIGFLILLLVLILELKDKLLAQDELAAGHAVQSAMIPDRSPSLSGWDIWVYTHPANEVGGDFVDYLKVDANRLGVALGDVAGKGLGAALFMVKLQSTLRALAPDFASLAELGERINAIFCRDGIPGRFASLIYLEIQPDSGIVRMVNAGHLPPVVVHGETIEEMPQGAAALGIMPGTAFNEQKVALQPEGLLVIYSDGITEARNDKDDFFGEQRLFSLLPELRKLSAEAAGSRLIDEVKKIVSSAQPSDDLSLIMLKRLP